MYTPITLHGNLDTFWILLIGILIAINCSLIGSYLVLKKIAIMGDAISHAILPGIAITFFITQSQSPLYILVGSSLTGLISTFFVDLFQKRFSIALDFSISINFSFFFALGIILISFFARKVDLDQDCILYGEISHIPLNNYIINHDLNLGPKALYTTLFSLLYTLFCLFGGYRNFLLTTFDLDFAKILGKNIDFWHSLFMSAVSLSIVSAFETTGVVLVTVLLIGPPTLAYLITKNILHMLLLSCFFGIFIVISGYYLAYWIDGIVSGAMAFITGILFVILNFCYRLNKVNR